MKDTINVGCLLFMLGVVWIMAIGLSLGLARFPLYMDELESYEDAPAQPPTTDAVAENSLDEKPKTTEVIVKQEEEKFDRRALIFGQFIKRLNRKIGGDWRKNGCKLKSVTFDEKGRTMKVKTTCKTGKAPTKAHIRKCKSMSLNFDEKKGYLTCGPPWIRDVVEEETDPVSAEDIASSGTSQPPAEAPPAESNQGQ